MNISVGSSYSKEHVAPFTASYAQRISKIHEQREIQGRKNEEDVIHARSAVGSTFRVSGPDNSRVYSGDRTFGLVRPLSVGCQRDGSSGNNNSASFRSTSSERWRDNNETQANNSSIQRAMTSFDRELQAQKDIAAFEKQKLALLQVKKESYINFLKNKGNTPWIPGGEGAKHETSLHKSVNRDAIEQRELRKAWCRSPWPGAVPPHKSPLNSSSRLGSERPYDIPFASSPQRSRPFAQEASSVDYYAFSPEGRSYDQNDYRPRPTSSPQRLPRANSISNNYNNNLASKSRDRIDSSDGLSVFSSVQGSVGSSQHRTRATQPSGTPVATAAAPAGSNSKYVALTVRLINTAHSAQKSSYGVFIVPRNCSRLEMIAHIERQFSVHNQVSDISITYRSGYSHSVTIKSLSMGTIADIPDVNDYSSITIFLGGSTVFDSAGNIITRSPEGEVLSSTPAVYGQAAAAVAAPPSRIQTQSGLHHSASGPSSVPGIDANDTLQFFDGVDVDVVSVDDDSNSAYSDNSSSLVAGSTRAASMYTATATAAATTTSAALASSNQQPVQVPLYESLHPDQHHHSFSYASPSKPLLGERGAAKLLTAPNGSYYSLPITANTSVTTVPLQKSQPQSQFEIGNYLMESEVDTDHLRGDEEKSIIRGEGTSGSRYHGDHLKRNIQAKKSSFRDRPVPVPQASAEAASPYRVSGEMYLYSDEQASSSQLGEPGGTEEETMQQKIQRPDAPPVVAVTHKASQPNSIRVPRDWLAEAEAQVQLEQRRQAFVETKPSLSRPAPSNHSAVNDSCQPFGSPAYRANTVNSQIRRQERESSRPAPVVRGRSRSRSRGRSEVESNNQPPGRSVSAGGRSGSTGRVRSRSVDASSVVTRPVSRSQWRPLPMPVSPAAAPLVRTTAASRSRTAYINSRSTDYVEVDENIYGGGGGRDNTSRGRPRSNSAGTTRSLSDGRRIHSFSHQSLPTAPPDFNEVWLSDPTSRHDNDDAYDRYGAEERGGGDNYHDTWREVDELQRVQEYQSMYPPQVQIPRQLNEGPQPGGAGDSDMSSSGVNALNHEDLMLPWAAHPSHAQYDYQGQGQGQGRQKMTQLPSGGRSSSSSGKHFAINLDELLAEIA